MSIIRDPEAVIGTWLDEGPAQLPIETRQAIVVGVRTFPRRRPSIVRLPFGGDGLGRSRTGWRRPPMSIVLVALLALAGVAALNFGQGLAPPTPPALPVSPADWTRVAIDPGAAGVVNSIASTPLGLLAQVGEGDESRLYFSADGLSWTQLPANEMPSFDTPRFSSN